MLNAVLKLQMLQNGRRKETKYEDLLLLKMECFGHSIMVLTLASFLLGDENICRI